MLFSGVVLQRWISFVVTLRVMAQGYSLFWDPRITKGSWFKPSGVHVKFMSTPSNELNLGFRVVHVVHLGDWLFVLHHNFFTPTPYGQLGFFFTKCVMESGINHNMFWFICLDVSKVFGICKE
jgi:hypothetical protein